MSKFCQDTIKLLIESINEGYLSDNWAENSEDIVLTETGYLALCDNTITTESGCVYHEDLDTNNFAWDDVDEVFRETDDIVDAYGRRGRTVYTSPDNCVEYRGDYYVSEYIGDNDLVIMYDGEISHIDYAYYWESDNEYHYEPEEESQLYGYHEGPKEKNFVNDPAPEGFARFGWGIEIEKSAMPDFDFDKEDLYQNTGAVIERDGSVSDGFELKTPIYNLFSEKTPERLKELEKFCNVRGVENAGGHIGFSMEGKTDGELLDLCRGFLPLIYAMHKKRLENDFCTGYKIDELKANGKKYQSIRLRGHYLEFRIFGAVRSFNSVIFRLDLFRIMARNLGANFARVLLMACDPSHDLHKLISRVYDTPEMFVRLVRDSFVIDQNIGEGKLTPDSFKKIEEKLRKAFKK